MYGNIYAILNKSENATLQYSIFCDKVLGEKYLLKLNNVCFPDIQQTIRRNSTNLFLLMSELCSLLCSELYDCACAEFVILLLH